jgi:hypothetical protein
MNSFAAFVEKIVGVLPRLRTPLQLAGLLVCVVAVLIVKIISPDNVAAMMSAGMIGVGLIIFATMFMILPLILQRQRAFFFGFMFLVYALITAYLINLTYQFLRSRPQQITDQGLSTVSATLSKRIASLGSRIDQKTSELETLKRRVDASQSMEERNELGGKLDAAQRSLNEDNANLAALQKRQADLAGTKELGDIIIVELRLIPLSQVARYVV